MNPNTINGPFFIGVAILAFLGILGMIYRHRQNQALRLRETQYWAWLSRLRTASKEDQRAASPFLGRVISGENREMRGPWENIRVPRD